MKIDYVYADDWCGLYVDGKLEYEGHSLDPYHVFVALKLPFNEFAVNEDWLCDEGRLPENLEDVLNEDEEYNG